LRERGVTVFAGSDNIRDCWSPYGNGDILDRAAIIAARHEMFTDRELGNALELVTCEADRALGEPRRGLGPGAVADFVALDSLSVADAIIDRPPRAFVLRAGRIAAEKGVLAGDLPLVEVADRHERRRS
jgi:cytosine deaminase